MTGAIDCWLRTGDAIVPLLAAASWHGHDHRGVRAHSAIHRYTRAYLSSSQTVIAVCNQQDVDDDGAVGRTSAAPPRPLR